MKKKILSLVLALAMVLPLCPVFELPTFAATSGKTGSCTWELDGTVLTISGNGKMGNYTSAGPWGIHITEVIIENGVTYIGNKAFYNCQFLVSVTIPNSVTSIGEYAFNRCLSLATVDIPSGVTSIGLHAFYNCPSLTTVTISDSVTSIGAYCFEACSSLSSLVVNQRNPVYHSEENCIIETNSKTLVVGCNSSVIPADGSVTSIGDGAFYGSNLTSITIPNSVTSIGEYAFKECIKLRSVTIENGVKIIGAAAFSECALLTDIDLGSSVVHIGEHAIASNYHLKSITIPDSVTFIGWYAFANCYALTSISIPEGVTEIFNGTFMSCRSLVSVYLPKSVKTIGENNFDYPRTIFYNGSESDRNNIDMEDVSPKNVWYFNYNDSASHVNYYEPVGPTGIVIRDHNGMAIPGCTVTIDGKEYTSGTDTLYVDIPEDYTGDVTVSKKGYITSTLSAEYVKYFTFFVLYPETEANPVVQHLLLRETSRSDKAFSDLLISDQYIYDLGDKHHNLYIQVAPNGNSIKRIYLKQGDTIVELQNGMNCDINTNGLFNSSKGTIYLCIETEDGKIYQMDSGIVALKKALTVNANIGGEFSSVVDEEMEAIGGCELKGKFNFGNIPVSIDISEDCSVKGTIGIKGKESDVATWYEAISSTIKSHEKSGKKEYDSETIEELVKGLEESGADFKEGYGSFGIDVEGSIIGYIEGKWNPYLGRLEDVKVGAIFKLSGGMSYVQQSVSAVVPLPYYWTVDFEMELAAKIGAELGYDAKNGFDFEIVCPEISFGIDLSGSLCLGMDKVVGGGGKVKGEIKLTFVEPNYDFTSCTVTAELKFGVTGQLAGHSADFYAWNGKHELYSSANKSKLPNKSTFSLDSINLMEKYASSSVLLASQKYNSAVYSTQQLNDSSFTFKSNGYTYAAPVIERLHNGNAVMVWVDYAENRLDINKTALFYSIYNSETGVWSEPTQVEDDGTADDLPVLKTFDGQIYLVWNDGDRELKNDNTFSDMLANMGISYAVFDGEKFTSITNVSGENNYMDICPDIAVVNGVPNVVWLVNEKNDLFGQNGKNKLMCATYKNSVWSSSCVFETSTMVNSFAVVEENNVAAIYFSTNNSSEYDSNNFEIFKLSSGACKQITDNDYADTSVASFDNAVYWKSPNQVQSLDVQISCEGIADKYIVIKDLNGCRSVIFTTNEGSYKICKETSKGFGTPLELHSGEGVSCAFAAYYDLEKLKLVTNELNANGTGSAIRINTFYNEDNVTITKAFYNNYTLMKGYALKTTVYVKNIGLKNSDGYTVQAYSGDTLLASKYFGNSLLPGNEINFEIFIPLPSDTVGEAINFHIQSGEQEINLSNVDFSMPLSLVDISVENATIITGEKSSKLNVSIVNRGISDIPNAIVKLHKNDEQGTLLNSVEIKNLESRSAEIIAFDISGFLDNVSKYYVTIDTLEGETFIGNNSDFTFVNSLEVSGLQDCSSNHTYSNNCDTTCNICGTEREVPNHIYDNACDTTCNECGAERQVPDHVYDNADDLICNICGYERPPYTPGDLDGVEGVDMDDAIYLLFYTSFPEDYPLF